MACPSLGPDLKGAAYRPSGITCMWCLGHLADSVYVFPIHNLCHTDGSEMRNSFKVAIQIKQICQSPQAINQIQQTYMPDTIYIHLSNNWPTNYTAANGRVQSFGHLSCRIANKVLLFLLKKQTETLSGQQLGTLLIIAIVFSTFLMFSSLFCCFTGDKNLEFKEFAECCQHVLCSWSLALVDG